MEVLIISNARYRAVISAVYTKLSDGMCLADSLPLFVRWTAETATPFSDFSPSGKIFSCAGYFKHSSPTGPCTLGSWYIPFDRIQDQISGVFKVQSGVSGTLENFLITPKLISAFSARGRILMPICGIQFGFFYVFFCESSVKHSFIGRIINLGVEFSVVVQA